MNTSWLVCGCLAAMVLFAAAVPAEETLYNGIRLPSPWPPKDHKLSLEPMALPYLASPPEVIPIDVGRQLFVDDFLVAQTTLTRSYHLPEYYPQNPVLKPDKPWEGNSAMVFSDGVWFDPQDKLFKMWYMGGYLKATCLATSTDGIHWEKPSFDVQPGTNIVLPEPPATLRDSNTVWLDLEEKDPQRRYKLVTFDMVDAVVDGKKTRKYRLPVYVSPDGIHWTEVAEGGPTGDRTTVFYNPFRKVWVYSLRSGTKGMGRTRHYWENPDLVAGAKWKAGEPIPWVGADKDDPRRSDLNIQCELYNLDAVGYESLMLGLFSIWRGQPKDRAKPNEICLGFSRDGFNWQRPDHRPFIPVSERYGDWNWGNVQSAGGGCLMVGDKLYFYMSGRAGVRGNSGSGVCATGLATLRRDGFASMDAGDADATLTTRPVKFGGKFLFVNVDAPNGELRTEALDEKGNAVPPFTRDNCEPVRADRTLVRVKWNGAADLSALSGKPVKFRFHLKNGRLYSFWVSPDPSGASHGYVAAGGPGFTGGTDTVGEATGR
jgi:hypothetical protein